MYSCENNNTERRRQKELYVIVTAGATYLDIGQLAVWDSESIFCRLPEIRRLFDERFPCWMLNIIDIGKRFSCFVCSGDKYQNKLGKIFNLSVNGGVAKTAEPYLRKEIIKTARFYQQKMETAPAVQKEVDRKW